MQNNDEMQVVISLVDRYGKMSGELQVLPLYVPITQAAKLSGFSQDTIRAWTRRARNPLPHIENGRKRMINTAELIRFARAEEVGR